MRKLLICALAVAMMAGCKGAPEEIERDKVAQICADPATQIREMDSFCREEIDGVRWFYVRYQESWPLELPALGEAVENGRYTWERPEKCKCVLISANGARFAES